jgi:hypothetical protein
MEKEFREKVIDSLKNYQSGDGKKLGAKFEKATKEDYKNYQETLERTSVYDIKLLKFFSKIMDTESSEKLKEVVDIISDLKWSVFDKQKWFFDRYHLFRTIEVSNDIYLDCSIPRDPDKGFYIRKDGNPVALEVEERFYNQNIEDINLVHRLLKDIEKIVSEYSLKEHTEENEKLADDIINYFGFTKEKEQKKAM